MDGDEDDDTTRKLRGTANNQIRNAYSRGGRALVDLKQKLLEENGKTLESLFKNNDNREVPQITTE